jgi:hypothetical protein
MSEQNQREAHQGPERRGSQGWHVDKNVSISHLLTTFAMLIAGFWFIAGQDKRIAENTLAIKHNETAIERQESRINRSLDSINSKLDKLTDLIIRGDK